MVEYQEENSCYGKLEVEVSICEKRSSATLHSTLHVGHHAYSLYGPCAFKNLCSRMAFVLFLLHVEESNNAHTNKLELMETFHHQLQKAEGLTAITQQIGYALWQLQELEGVAAQYFVLLTQAQKGMGLARGNELVEKAKAKTFGSTVHQLSKAVLLSSDLEARFTKILAERNWLVHKSRASSRSAIHDDAVMRKLLARLEAIADESNTLLKAIAVLAESFVKQQGVSAQEIDINAKNLLVRWHTEGAS